MAKRKTRKKSVSKKKAAPKKVNRVKRAKPIIDEASSFNEAKTKDEVVKPAAKAPEIKKGWSVSEAGILLRDGELVKCPFEGFKHCNNKCPHYEDIKLSPPKTRVVGAMLTCGTGKRISFDS